MDTRPASARSRLALATWIGSLSNSIPFLRRFISKWGRPRSLGTVDFKQISRAIDNPAVEVVSFDVYDTLLVRPVLEPVDLFFLTGEAWRERGFRGDFVALRKEAERLARAKMRHRDPTCEEPTLDAIYESLRILAGITGDEASTVLGIEIQNEERALSARLAVADIYDYALRSGKKIIAISDTYAPAILLLEALRRNGFMAIERLYTSSETGRCKATGKLFPLVLEDLGLSGEQVVHVGDNAVSDVKQARRAGIRAFHIPPAAYAYFGVRNFCTHWAANDTPLVPQARLLLGMTINACFDRPAAGSWKDGTLLNEDPRILGYAFLGPLSLFTHSGGPADRWHPVWQWMDGFEAAGSLTPEAVTARNAARKFRADTGALLGKYCDDRTFLVPLAETLLRMLAGATTAPDKRLLARLPPLPVFSALECPARARAAWRAAELEVLRPLLLPRKYIGLVTNRKFFFAATKNPVLKCYGRLCDRAACR